jgi:hypothetical protein
LGRLGSIFGQHCLPDFNHHICFMLLGLRGGILRILQLLVTGLPFCLR